MNEKELIEKFKPFAESNYADSTAMQCGTHIKNATKCAEIAQAYAKEIAVEFDEWKLKNNWAVAVRGNYYFNVLSSKSKTFEELYTIFLNQRNK